MLRPQRRERRGSLGLGYRGRQLVGHLFMRYVRSPKVDFKLTPIP